MRAIAVVVLALALPGTAAAHPGFVDIANHRFDPQILNVTAGVLVEWRWDGPDVDHTVTSDTGAFDSDPEGPVLHERGDTFAHWFDEPGTYAYRCKVHPNMTGKVVVEAPSQRDERAPKLTRLAARLDGRVAVVRFRIDERASVLAEVRRPGRRRVLADAFRFVGPGARAVRVKVPRGRSVVRLQATDGVGNASRPRAVSVHR